MGWTGAPKDPVKGPDTPKPDDPVPEEKADVATEADFEEEATKEITAENLEKELGALEEELED